MRRAVLFALAVPTLLAGCRTAPAAPALEAVSAWAVQLQGLETEGAVDRLVAAPVDLVVIDATRTVRGQESFATREVVGRIRAAGKLCLAYVNVGQAESYRTYWRPEWRAPTGERPGAPSFLLTVDPEGWEGNFPVAFWDLRWRAILWGSSRGLVDMAIADGFDGVYLDWILGYEEPAVAKRHQDPAGEMVALVRELRLYARSRKPGFLVVAQNGAALPGLGEVIDGFVLECLSFSCEAGAAWESDGAGDIAAQGRETRAAAAQALGVPVFTLDYARVPANARAARAYSRGRGFLPFVSCAPLDRLP